MAGFPGFPLATKRGSPKKEAPSSWYNLLAPSWSQNPRRARESLSSISYWVLDCAHKFRLTNGSELQLGTLWTFRGSMSTTLENGVPKKKLIALTWSDSHGSADQEVQHWHLHVFGCFDKVPRWDRTGCGTARGSQ